jgi:hypothetical protein
MSKKSLFAGLLCAAVLTGANASAAFAGEVTGSGERTDAETHANSICVFSGLEDGEEGGPSGPGVPPQNWGQIPKEVRDQLAQEGAHPGDACNGHTGFFAGGGGE